MKIALVYDRVNKFGGAERLLLALHKIWPEAPLYTALYSKKDTPWANSLQVRPSFLNKLAFLQKRHELLPFIIPYAFESMDFSGYDVVISVTSTDAKGIITKPGTLHICYCLTPTRYLWSGFRDYLNEPGNGYLNPLARLSLKLFSAGMRKWDYLSAQRPDIMLAISKTVALRIDKYYNRPAEIIYPPVDTKTFYPPNAKKKNNYFLIVSRLVPYKKIDKTIDIFNKLNYQLKIVGTGSDLYRLKKKARKNISFLGYLTDRDLCCYYQNCKALIFPGEEDFGLTVLEAQSCGTPVIAINKGGVRESIAKGKTGELYEGDSPDAFIRTLKKFESSTYLSSDCRDNALKFSTERFNRQMKIFVQTSWDRWRKIL